VALVSRVAELAVMVALVVVVAVPGVDLVVAELAMVWSSCARPRRSQR
jgi:Flp pilus assembly pilin Flp